ncbi:autotransporter outer membrane beta-barrel domain-containing protein [Klebsiella aerogenes]
MPPNNLNPQAKKYWKLSSITLAILAPFSVHSALAADENHTSTTGNQTVSVDNRTINDDYYSFQTYGNIDMSVSDTSVNLGSSPGQQVFVVDAGIGGIDFTANNLNTSGGTTKLVGDKDITATIDNSHLGSYGSSSSDALWIKSDAGSIDTQISNSELDGRLDVDAYKDASVAIEGSQITKGIRAVSNDQTTLSISNSSVTGTNSDSLRPPLIHVEGDKGVSVSIDNSTIGLTDDSPAATGPDVEVISASGGTSSVSVNHSSVQNGISTYSKGADSTISVNDSQIGTEETAGNAPYTLVAQSARGVPGQGNATVALDSSTVYGDVSAQSWGDAQANVNITNDSTLNGNVNVIGGDMTVNIDNSTLNGDITTRGYTSSDGSTNTTVNVSNTTWGGDITSVDNEGDLTVNVNSGAIVGGQSLDDPMSVTGYDSVNFNINYLDPSLVNTGKESYFYFNTDESVLVNSSLATGTLAPIRSGAYIMDDIVYDAENVSDQAGSADTGSTWDVTFHTDKPVPPDPDPTPDPAPTPDPDPTPPQPDSDNVASDLQAAKAGLLASEDMIHRIANGITHQLDMQTGADTGSHLWLQGIYASGDRTAGETDYNNDISGFQIGGDYAIALNNNSVIHTGAALGYLHNDLDLNNGHGYNDIDGTYYSLYAHWNQLLSDTKRWGWFADLVATYGDMSYGSYGKDGRLSAGASYDGDSALIQARLGAKVLLPQQFWLQPYVTLGYDNIHTEHFSDGYSDVGTGRLDGVFVGVGTKAGTEITAGHAKLRPYVELSWVGQFGSETKFGTSDYHFAGQNLDGGNAGVGMDVDINDHWSANASVNSEFGHDIDHEVNTYLSVKYKF